MPINVEHMPSYGAYGSALTDAASTSNAAERFMQLYQYWAALEEQKRQQQFQTGERMGSQTFQTGERKGSQEFSASESQKERDLQQQLQEAQRELQRLQLQVQSPVGYALSQGQPNPFGVKYTGRKNLVSAYGG